MSESDRIRIVPATTGDVDAVTDLWVALAAGQRRYGATLRSEANRGAVRQWVTRSVVTEELLVARDDDELVGFVGFELDRGGYERDRTRGTVSNLFVVAGRRGEGTGTKLLDAAEQALRDAGADAVALEALAANDRAREFYADRGYEPHRVELTKSLRTNDAEVGDTHGETADTK